VDDDPSGLALSRHQCLALLDACRVGRVVFTEHALPAALPVNFSLLDDDIVFRTATGGKLAVALSRAVVAFQADDIDPVSETGWTVLVQGWATLITRPDELARARDLELQSWAPGDRWHFVRIRSEILSGHRFVRRPTGSAVTARASTPAPAGDGPAVASGAGAAG
jgi:nitroimidazol reductase NimA-like FMN-containing flavoprotein (pyridoxamine 5'-phosphate oxidase superfamily)